ncbi:MAG TPA: DUF3667 domain-containing protein [Rubricoccaceae bacterium]
MTATAPIASPSTVPASGLPAEACLNCGASLVGPFCAACGQRVQPLQQPLHVFAVESFVEYFGFDGRTWRSMRDLLFRPGMLTVDYVEGRRKRSLSPLKLYLTATLLFFVTLGLVRTDEARRAPEASAIERESDAVFAAPPTFPPDTLLTPAAAADALDAHAAEALDDRRALARAARLVADTAAARSDRLAADSVRAVAVRFAQLRDSVAALGNTARVRAAAVGLPTERATVAKARNESSLSWTSELDGLPDWLRGDVVRRLERARTPAERDDAQEAAFRAIGAQIPTTLFVVLPVFAVLLKALYTGGGGIALRGRRSVPRPAPAPPDAGWRIRAGTAFRRVMWQVARARDRRALRRRVRAGRRPWWRALRRLREHLPAQMRVTRTGWLRRAATARRTRFYAEHVVFTLHVHAFTFVMFWLLLLVEAASGPGWAAVWLAASIPVYFVLAQRRVYAQTWGKTLVKSALLGTAYTVVLTFGAMVAIALAARLG